MNMVRGTFADFAEFYARHRGRLPVSLEQAAQALRGWSVWRLDDDRPVAVFLVKDGQGHVSGYKTERVGVRRIRWGMEKLGITKTAVDKDFAPGHALARRLGFAVDHTEGRVTHYARISH